MEKKEPSKTSTMRKEWFAYVRKVRKKLSRGKGKEPCTHRAAMSAASETWAAEKQKILRRQKREKKALKKQAEEWAWKNIHACEIYTRNA